MSAFRDRIQSLSRVSRQQVEALWQRHLDGELSEERFVRLAAAVIARANGRAVSLADLALTAAFIRELGEMVPPLGLLPREPQIDLDRLVTSTRTVLAAEVDVEELAESQALRLGRLAEAEPLNTAQDAMQRAMEEREVAGWTRETGGKACPLCQQWADGVVRPVSARMATHVGCSCAQVPAI